MGSFLHNDDLAGRDVVPGNVRLASLTMSSSEMGPMLRISMLVWTRVGPETNEHLDGITYIQYLQFL